VRQLAAILGDSLREAVDRRSLLVLVLISVLPIVFCFGLSFDRESLDQVLERHVGELRSISRGRLTRRLELDQELLSIEPVAGDTGWPAEVYDGSRATVRFPEPAQLDALADAWREARKEAGESPPDPGPRPKSLVFLEQRFGALGWDEVAARQRVEDPTLFEVAVVSRSPATLQGAFAASMLFGAFEVPLREVSVAMFVTLLQISLAQSFVGFLGLLIALITCAGFVPNMLQKGTLDLLLARPLSRQTLLVGKYLGGLWYVAIVATFLIAGCWAGLAIRSGYSSPGFLTSIPSLLLAFAMLHAVSVLVGVLTRSNGVAALAALGVWGAAVVVGKGRAVLESPMLGNELDLPRALREGIDVAWWILPKIPDIDAMNSRVIAAGTGATAQLTEGGGQLLPNNDPVAVIGSSLLFVIAVVGLACIAFRRRDY
jgi:hypothetical protein